MYGCPSRKITMVYSLRVQIDFTPTKFFLSAGILYSTPQDQTPPPPEAHVKDIGHRMKIRDLFA